MSDGGRFGGRGARCALVALMVGVALAAGASRAAAGLAFDRFQGTLGVGYSLLLVSDAPGGNIAAGAGFDYPVATELRVGPMLVYHLLGSRTVERGSLLASVDYSAFEAMLLAHWTPRTGRGPVGRVSFGPGLMHASADLSSGGGGPFFRDLARSENVLALGLDATLMRRRPAPVRVGLELGSRFGFLSQETWTLFTSRLVFHY